MDNLTDLSYTLGITYKSLTKQKQTPEQKLSSILDNYTHSYTQIKTLPDDSIDHGIACSCCTRIVRIESCTHPFGFEVKAAPKKPGRPKMRGIA